MHHVTIIRIRKPAQHDVNKELQWLGSSLGLFGMRDRDKTCFRLFIELLKSTGQQHPVSSDELAVRLHLSRGTVVHHLNRLMESGLVVHEQNKYLLRSDSLSEIVEEIQRDLNRTFEDLHTIAKNIDKRLNL